MKQLLIIGKASQLTLGFQGVHFEFAPNGDLKPRYNKW
jgi:hypothetical protein